MKTQRFYHLKHSLFARFMLPLVVIIAAQGILFYSMTLWGRPMQLIEDNAYVVFEQQVTNRANYFTSTMTRGWANLYDSAGEINRKMDAMAAASGNTAHVLESESLKQAFLLQCTSDVVSILRKTSSTGAYLILDDAYLSADGLVRNGIYIYDPDPLSTASDNSDLSMRCGYPELYRQASIATDVNWKPYFVFEDHSNQAITRSIDTATQNPHLALKDLGYWQKASAYGYPNDKTITYTLPLMDGNGLAYGVLAVELSEEQLQSHLPYRELHEDSTGAYTLAISSGDGQSYQPLAHSCSTRMYHSSELGDTITLVPSQKRAGFSLLAQDKDAKKVVAVVRPLSVYSDTSPFAGEQWVLIGMVTSDSLLGFIQQTRNNTTVTGTLCFLAVAALATFIFHNLVRPIERLVAQLRNNSPHNPVVLEQSGYAEIDELAAAIEHMRTQVHESSSMLSRIISVSNIKIAAFEYDKSLDEATYTDQFFPLLWLPQPESADYFLKGDDFKAIFEGWDYEVEETFTNGWMLRISTERRLVRWIKLIIIDDANKLLGVAADVTEEIMSKRRIEYERDYDLLTNLLNRRAFLQTLGRLFEEPRQLKVAAMVMLDLDNLKHINDEYGHDIGDRYLEATANILKRMPIQNIIVSRMSGDEFFVFIYGYEKQEHLQIIVDSIKDTIADSHFTLPGTESIRVRCSGGVAWYPKDGTTVDQLIKQADFAMYTAKNTMKGEFCEFDNQSYSQNSYLLHSREELNKLIDGSLVSYAFQPIVEAGTGAVFAYESLMRSQLETLRSPLEVLGLAKSQSKLYEIERITWFNSLKQASGDLNFVDGGCKLFINSVSNQVLNANDIRQLSQLYMPYLHRVVLEITEEEKFTEELTRRKQEVLQNWGGQVALDDFGTGYNGDIALLMLSPDYVKIDMSIVRNIDTDNGRQGIFRNLVSYCRDHDIKVIAEGVETRSEMATLIELGADYLQGFYVGRPNKQMIDIDHSIAEEIKQLASNNNLGNDEATKV